VKTGIKVLVYVDGNLATTVRAVSNEETCKEIPELIRRCTRKGLGVVERIESSDALKRITAIHIVNPDRKVAATARAQVVPIGTARSKSRPKLLSVNKMSALR
jgi:hypothetical protein